MTDSPTWESPRRLRWRVWLPEIRWRPACRPRRADRRPRTAGPRCSPRIRPRTLRHPHPPRRRSATPALESTTVTQILTSYTVTSQMPQYMSFDSRDWEPFLRSVAHYRMFFWYDKFSVWSCTVKFVNLSSCLVCGGKIRRVFKYRKESMEMIDFSVTVYLDFLLVFCFKTTYLCSRTPLEIWHN